MVNWSGAAKAAAGGAVTGGTIGSFFPGIGTAIGAGVGGVGAGLLGLFSKTDEQSQKDAFGQTPNKFSPEQQSALNLLLKQGQTGLQNPTAGFEPIEQQARSKFARESIPGLAERFTSVGGSGTRGSSDFAGVLGGAQSDFDQGIAALKAQYGQQGQQNALQMLQSGLTPQNEQIYFGSAPDVGDQLLQTGGNVLGSYLSAGGDFGLGGNNNESGIARPTNVVGSYSSWKPNQKSAFAKFIQSLNSKGGV